MKKQSSVVWGISIGAAIGYGASWAMDRATGWYLERQSETSKRREQEVAPGGAPVLAGRKLAGWGGGENRLRRPPLARGGVRHNGCHVCQGGRPTAASGDRDGGGGIRAGGRGRRRHALHPASVGLPDREPPARGYRTSRIRGRRWDHARLCASTRSAEPVVRVGGGPHNRPVGSGRRDQDMTEHRSGVRFPRPTNERRLRR